MNEWIKQLAEQAGAYMPGPMGIAGGHPAVGFQDLELFEKFAELIVKECADVAKTLHYPHFGQESEDYEERFDVSFKEHFGFNN